MEAPCSRIANLSLLGERSLGAQQPQHALTYLVPPTWNPETPPSRWPRPSTAREHRDDERALYEERRLEDARNQRPQNAIPAQMLPDRARSPRQPLSPEKKRQIDTVRGQTNVPTSSARSSPGAQSDVHPRSHTPSMFDLPGTNSTEGHNWQGSLRSGQLSPAMDVAVRNKNNQFTQTSNPQQRMAPKNNVDSHHDATDAANGLSMFPMGDQAHNQFAVPKSFASSSFVNQPASYNNPTTDGFNSASHSRAGGLYMSGMDFSIANSYDHSKAINAQHLSSLARRPFEPSVGSSPGLLADPGRRMPTVNLLPLYYPGSGIRRLQSTESQHYGLRRRSIYKSVPRNYGEMPLYNFIHDSRPDLSLNRPPDVDSLLHHPPASAPPAGNNASAVSSSDSTSLSSSTREISAARDMQGQLLFPHKENLNPEDSPWAQTNGSMDVKVPMFITYTISEDLTGNQDNVMSVRLAGLTARCGRSSFPQIRPEGAEGGGLGPVNSLPEAENAPVSTSDSGSNMQRHIISALQQGPFNGWQDTITVDQRAIQVKLLIDSLRLIKPVIGLIQAVQVAIAFELKALLQSQSLDAYVSMCKEKLSQIHETRQQQQQQRNSMDIGQAMNPNITAHQEGMQESINPTQGQQPKSLPPWKPSKEDNEAINKLAAQMAEKTSREDIAKIRANLDNMTMQQRELMNQKGVDPLVYFFRTQAVKEYRRQKMNAIAAGSIADINGDQDDGL